MSQMSGMTPESGATSAKPSNTGRAVLLLAIAVVLGVALLHELDNSPTTATLANKKTEEKAATQPVVTSSSTTVPPRSPAEVKVLVANGVGVAGAASKVAQRLQPIGYNLVKPGNTINKETVSSVQYAAGYQGEALQLATSLGLPSSAVQALPTPAPVADMAASSVLVIVGNDLATTGTANGTTTQSGNATNPLTNGPLTTNTSTLSGAGTNGTNGTTGTSTATSTPVSSPTNNTN
jgi:hypothetical protein